LGILVSEEPRIEEVEYEGDKYIIEVADLTWSQKNKIISRSTNVDVAGRTSFDIDLFNRECLLAIIKSIKKVSKDKKEKDEVIPVNAQLFQRIKSDFGSILEGFIPSPATNLTKKEEKN